VWLEVTGFTPIQTSLQSDRQTTTHRHGDRRHTCVRACGWAYHWCAGWSLRQSTNCSGANSPIQILCIAVNRGNLHADKHTNTHTHADRCTFKQFLSSPGNSKVIHLSAPVAVEPIRHLAAGTPVHWTAVPLFALYLKYKTTQQTYSPRAQQTAYI